MALDILLYTIGNREVYIDGQNPNRDSFRSQCRRMLEAVRGDATQLARVDVPRLRACLEYIRRQGVEELHAVHFVVTENNPNPRFAESDTREAGELAKEWLTRLVRPAMGRFLGKVRAGLILLSGVEPQEWGQVYEALTGHYARLPGAEDVARAWVYPIAGTPAMSASVILHSLARWRDRVRMLIVPEGENAAEESRFPHAFLADMRRELMMGRLESYDLAGALALAPDAGPLRELLASALARSRFQFVAARRHLDAALPDAPARAREAIRRLRDALDKLPDRPKPVESRGHLVELLWNARLCWRAGRVIDFLGRLYQFDETVRRYWLERLGFPTDDSPAERERSRRGFWGRAQELGLTQALAEEYGLEVGGPLNRPAFAAVLDALLATGRAGELAGEIRALLPLLEGPVRQLSELRNRTHHGFEPVDHERVRMEVAAFCGPEGDPVEMLLGRLLECLAPGADDPYERTAAIARDLLGRA